MDYKIVRTIEGFEALKEDWERIEKNSPIITYFSTFVFNYTWWSVYCGSKDIELHIIVVYQDKRVAGIAPLQIRELRRRLYSTHVLEFLHGGGDYSDFLIDLDVTADPMKIITTIFTALGDNHNNWDEIWLTHISQHTLLSHYLLKSGYNNSYIYLMENPYIDFSKFDSFEKYTKAFLPKKIRQYVNRFQREVDFRMIVTNENVINQISKIHVAEKSYLQTKGKIQRHSLFEDSYAYRFLDLLYSNDNVLTYMLVDSDSNQEIICYYSGYVYNSVFHSVVTAYNPRYQRLAVGKIFNYMIFENNMKERRWKIFDMGTGRYAWKFEMTNTFNLLYQYHVFQPNSKKMYYLDKCEKLISAILQFLRK